MTSPHHSGHQLIGLALLALLLIVSLETAAKFQLDYAVPLPPPPKNGLSQLVWIRDQFGYANPNVIIVVRDTNSYLWALAYAGGLIYFGNLFYLLANQTDYGLLKSPDSAIRSDYLGSIQKLWVSGALGNLDSGKYSILVPSEIYEPDVLEMQVLRLLGGGILSVDQTSQSRIKQLFAAWTNARSSNDILKAAAPYLAIDPLVDCSTYSSVISTSSQVTINVASNFTDNSRCSLHVTTGTLPDAMLYATLNGKGTWNLTNESYVGFYFRGTTNSTRDYSFTILLSSAPEYSSFYYYTVADQGLWDGGVHGLVIPLSEFEAIGNPGLSSIDSIRLGVYTGQGGTFNYSLEYLVAAHSI